MVIYKTTNMVNGKIYVGKDVSHPPAYLGSGTLLLRAIKKYGVESFNKVVLETCSTLESLNDREKYWIKTLGSTNRAVGYNIAEGGTGGNTSIGKSTEEKRKISEKRTATLRKNYEKNPELKEARKRNQSAAMKKHWTPECRKTMSEKMMGRIITWKDKLTDGIREWHRCNKHLEVSAETREKISLSSKGRVIVAVSDELELKIVELYPEWGIVQMTEKLKSMGHCVSPYIIRRILKKHGVYKRYKKGKFHAPPRSRTPEERKRHSESMKQRGRRKIDPDIEARILELYADHGIKRTGIKMKELGYTNVGRSIIARVVKAHGVCRVVGSNLP